MNTKVQPLLAEDGAIFIGHIVPVDNGQFQAACNAELHLGAQSLVEMPEYFLADSREGARTWIAGMARARGFARWRDALESE